jgi:TrmH family RNA methyltransferase
MSATGAHAISSIDNPRIKSVRKALRKGALTDDGLLIVEGFRMLAEARRSGVVIDTIIATPSAVASIDNPAARLLVVPDALFRQLSDTPAPQGILALVELPQLHPTNTTPLVLVLDALQDPGNVGTILRSAEAFGATSVIALPGTVDIANSKVVRAAAGSLFRVPVQRQSLESIVDLKLPIFFADGEGPLEIDQVPWHQPLALVIGNEGNGVSAAVRRIGRSVRIQTVNVESLNAAIAASILLHEASRHRRSNV